jgi:environmental stress-induced protein Ves
LGPTIRIIAAKDFVEGPWLNGLGRSWDIASYPVGARGHTFDWRFAIARIDGDVPFSHYPGIDRVFTLIDGPGLDLDIVGSGKLLIDQPFIPQRFPGDAETFCRLRSTPCRALNLFCNRSRVAAEVNVFRNVRGQSAGGPTLFFLFTGRATLDGVELECGAAAIAEGKVAWDASSGLLYTAELSPRTAS